VLAERESRLTAIGAGLQIERAFPLMLEFRLPQGDFTLAKLAVEHYIAACLRAVGNPGAVPAGANILRSSCDSIRRLPNLTGNGVLLPKLEVLVEFNAVLTAVGNLVGGLRLDDNVEAIQLPLNRRLTDGRVDRQRDERAYASSKLHTDIWAGQPSHAFTVIIPLLGDHSMLVEFFEPDERLLGLLGKMPERLAHYWPLVDWYAIGWHLLLFPGESFDECRGRVPATVPGSAPMTVRAA
jgi:hypothetical protein